MNGSGQTRVVSDCRTSLRPILGFMAMGRSNPREVRPAHQHLQRIRRKPPLSRRRGCPRAARVRSRICGLVSGLVLVIEGLDHGSIGIGEPCFAPDARRPPRSASAAWLIVSPCVSPPIIG